jgi:hypothetical protein
MSVIVPKASQHYVAWMSLRPFFAILVGFAMLFAPLGMISGSAMAKGPAANHHAQIMESGHCDEQPATGKDGKPDSKSCCIAMCAAIAVEPGGPAEPQVLVSSTERPSLAKFDHSFLAELPTPPPRPA